MQGHDAEQWKTAGNKSRPVVGQGRPKVTTGPDGDPTAALAFCAVCAAITAAALQFSAVTNWVAALVLGVLAVVMLLSMIWALADVL